jgi:myo-inositol-1-phosphate synthase
MSIKIAIVGVGNCASSLVQGLAYYRNFKLENGLILRDICGYQVSDIEIVEAFDINKRKIGVPIRIAIEESPNSSKNICKIENIDKDFNICVTAGPVLDGVSKSVETLVFPHDIQLELCEWQRIIVNKLLESEADVLISFLPVGSKEASIFYAECALEAKVAFANTMPEFICSTLEWHEKFSNANVPCAGDDIKSQFGATYLHRLLVSALQDRGHLIDKTTQINSGGNLDFLNMSDEVRLTSKITSKTEAVRSLLNSDLCDLKVKVNEYIPDLKDTKICHISIQSRHFANCSFTLEAKLTVQDSPNSAGVVVDVIRLLKVAKDNNLSGYQNFSAYYFKHPMKQYKDEVAREILNSFINKYTCMYERECND